MNVLHTTCYMNVLHTTYYMNQLLAIPELKYLGPTASEAKSLKLKQKYFKPLTTIDRGTLKSIKERPFIEDYPGILKEADECASVGKKTRINVFNNGSILIDLLEEKIANGSWTGYEENQAKRH